MPLQISLMLFPIVFQKSSGHYALQKACIGKESQNTTPPPKKLIPLWFMSKYPVQLYSGGRAA